MVLHKHHEPMRAAIKKLFDHCPEPVLVTDTKARIVYVNPAWEILTKYKLREVQGKNPRLLQSGKTPPHVYQNMWRALAKKQGFQTEEVIDKRKDGKEYSIHSAIYPIQSRGKTRFYMQIQHDISRRKIADEQKRILLSLVAHELKSPLTAAKFLAEANLSAAHRGNAAPQQLLADIQRMYARLTGMLRLIDDILNLGRLETNKLQLRKEIMSLNQIVREVADQMKVFSPTHHIKITGPRVEIIADADRIRQVIFNLLTNAIKYSGEGKTIDITISQTPAEVTVCVQDSGIGIPKAEHDRIFDRFYQVKQRTQQGFGLGLFISREIIRRHKGKIWVESTVGKGSKFFFSLPRTHSFPTLPTQRNTAGAIEKITSYSRISTEQPRRAQD